MALKIQELAEQGLPFQQVVRQTEQYIYEMNTYFVLESLDNLRKNGRLTKLQSIVTSTLRIKLLMGATPEGEICKKGQALSVKQALGKMVELISSDEGHRGRLLAISHCNCLDRAFYLKDLLQEKCLFREILISETHGISTVYANDGGIIVAYALIFFVPGLALAGLVLTFAAAIYYAVAFWEAAQAYREAAMGQ